MLGYYKDPELTKTVIDGEGWFHTGDVGHLEEGTFLMITDRKKEIFKLSSGKFVAPQPLENNIKESPFIDQVMVIGEHQKFASAILVPDFKYLQEWADHSGLKIRENIKEIAGQPELMTAMNKEISKINKNLSEHERIKRFRIVTDEWTPQSGELSASLKLKRKFVEAKYADIINDIYQIKSSS